MLQLDVEVSPITSQHQITDDRDSLALELHAIYITAVDSGLNGRYSIHENNYYCYSVFMHYTLNRVVIRRQLRLVLYKLLWTHRIGWHAQRTQIAGSLTTIRGGKVNLQARTAGKLGSPGKFIAV